MNTWRLSAAAIELLILVDTNVLLDVVTDDPRWADWSLYRLTEARLRDQIGINAAIYAELSPGYPDNAALDAALEDFGIGLIEIPRPALFLAGKAFRAYRRRGGLRTGVLSDFFIGAHAVVEGMALITRDTARYRTYFPSIELIAPGG
jgi:hypothetical protein